MLLFAVLYRSMFRCIKYLPHHSLLQLPIGTNRSGNCPVFNKTLKSIPCISKSSSACPTVIYKSNTVFNYPACFPDNSFTRISSTTTRGVNHAVQQQNTSTIRTSTHDGGAGPELLALILLIIPVVIVFVFLQRRGYIKRWRRNINRRRHPDKMAEDSASPSPCDAGHMGSRSNVKNDRDEREALICTNDSTTLSAEGSDTTVVHRPPAGESQSSGRTKEIQSTPKGCDTTVVHRPPAGESQSLGRTKEIQSTPKGRRIHVVMPNISFIDGVVKSLSSLNIMVFTGLPGSGKTSIANETVVSVCQNFTTGTNVRHPKDMKELEGIRTDKATFLIVDEYIKSWFNKNIIDALLKNVENVVKAGKGKVHALICVPDTLSKNVEEFLKNSSLQYEIYDLNVKGYTEKDWGSIFDTHMQSRIDWIRNQKYQTGDIDKYREAYIKCKPIHIGKPRIPLLLFQNEYYFKNASKFLENPYDSILQRITALSESWWSSNVRHFVFLVIVMLHNGEAKSEDIDRDMVNEICRVFEVKTLTFPNDLQLDELEQYGNIVSIRCRETVRVTFDVLWKKRKDLIIKYCDDELFLERVSLREVTKRDLLAIYERFQSMISAGTPYVGEHNILEELRSKCSTLHKETGF